MAEGCYNRACVFSPAKLTVVAPRVCVGAHQFQRFRIEIATPVLPCQNISEGEKKDDRGDFKDLNKKKRKTEERRKLNRKQINFTLFVFHHGNQRLTGV